MFKPSLLAASVAACSSFAFAAEAVLPTVVVTAARLPQAQSDVIGDLSVVTRDQLDNYRGQSLADVLARQPGIQISSNGGTGKTTSIFIRGANSGHTLVLIDGVRHGSATLGTPTLQHIPADQIDHIEILRGPAASLYGADAIGGVIQIFTRQSSKNRPISVEVGAGNLGQKQATVSAGTESNGSRFSVTLAHDAIDGVSAISNPYDANFNPDNDGYRNSSLSLSASHKLNADNEFGVSLLLAQVKNKFDSASYDLSDFTYSTYRSDFDYRDEGDQGAASLWSSSKLSDIWTAKILLGSSLDDSDTISPTSYADNTDSKSSFKTRQQQASWQNELGLGNGILTLGLETLQQKISGTTDYPVEKRRINSVNTGYLAKIDALMLQVNARRDDNSQFGAHNSYQAGASWEFQPGWQVGSTLGTAFLAPSFNDLYYPFYGDPTLKPEKSKNAEIFVRVQQDQLKAGLTIYRNMVKDLIQYNFAKGPFGAPDNIGKAKLTGATLNLDWQGESLLAGGSIDALQAKDDSDGINKGKRLVRRADKAATVYAGYHQAGWQTRAEVQALGKRYDDASNTVELGGYGLLNLFASWQVTPEVAVGLRLNNALDKSYTEVQNYGTYGRNGLLSLTWQPK